MILLIAGTQEGREIESLLSSKGYKVLSVIKPSGFDEVPKSESIQLVIDASHPFPGGISELAKDFCRQHNIRYIRFIRDEVELPASPLLYPVDSWEQAVEKAAGFGKTVFLTTGSYNLELFLNHPSLVGKRLVVRVLPDHQVIEKIQSLGIAPKNIVAMQGPFSKEMNRITFKMYNASVIVTKDSGRAGGTDTKLSAALQLKIPVVIIKRPKLHEKDYAIVHTYEQVLAKVSLLLKANSSAWFGA